MFGTDSYLREKIFVEDIYGKKFISFLSVKKLNYKLWYYAIYLVLFYAFKFLY